MKRQEEQGEKIANIKELETDRSKLIEERTEKREASALLQKICKVFNTK